MNLLSYLERVPELERIVCVGASEAHEVVASTRNMVGQPGEAEFFLARVLAHLAPVAELRRVDATLEIRSSGVLTSGERRALDESETA